MPEPRGVSGEAGPPVVSNRAGLPAHCGPCMGVVFRHGPAQGPLFFCQHKPMVRAVSLHASDFQRALGTRPVSRTAHFVLHALPPQLSTGSPVTVDAPVDDAGRPVGLPVWRLGLVLPKKQAKRSVTRSLIRHQAREALLRHAPAVVQGTPASAQGVDGWVLRLRSTFDRQQFPSAASDALKVAVRLELDELWAQLARGGWRLPAPSPAPAPRRVAAAS
jgi:ribonuclease P protein component